MFSKLLLILFYLLMPAAVIWVCNRVKVLGKIGPVLVLYFLGVIVANLNIFPDGAAKIQNALSTAIVPLAIPMMLFGCDFKKFSIKKSLLSFCVGTVAVVAAVVVGFVLFKDRLGDEGAVMGGALAGKCTGGTPNLAALKLMLGMKDTTFILLNSYDMLICFLYLIFLMSFGIKLSRKFLGRGRYTAEQEVNVDEYVAKNPYRDFGKKSSIMQLSKVLVAAILIMGCSFGVATLAKQIDENIFMVVMILTLTTLALLLSTWSEVKSWDKSYDAGMYLIYIFSLVVASMADLRTIDFMGGLYTMLYQVVIVFGSLLLRPHVKSVQNRRRHGRNHLQHTHQLAHFRTNDSRFDAQQGYNHSGHNHRHSRLRAGQLPRLRRLPFTPHNVTTVCSEPFC